MQRRLILLSLLILIVSSCLFATNLQRGIDFIENKITVIFSQDFVGNADGIIPFAKSNGIVQIGDKEFDQLCQTAGVIDFVQRHPYIKDKEWHNKEGIYLQNIYDLILDGSVFEEDFVYKFDGLDNVVKAELDPIYHTYDFGTVEPNDPMYSTHQWHHGLMECPKAWALETGTNSGEVIVAIIDTGVDWNHPDLADNIWQNLGEDADGDGHTMEYNGSTWILDPGDINGSDNDGNGRVDDLIGYDIANNDNNPDESGEVGWEGLHGTHVAGCAAAKGNNEIGLTGVCWDMQIMPIRCRQQGGTGVSSAGTAILYAVNNGAKIINCSFGSTYPSNQYYYEFADDHGVLVMCAAGNDDRDNDITPHYPSDFPTTVSVAAIGQGDQKTSYSCWGSGVDLCAPGGDGVEDAPATLWSTAWNNTYHGWQGTSMASPVAAGVAALLWSTDPSLTHTEVKDILIATGKDIDDLNPAYAEELGRRVQPFDAVASQQYSNVSFDTALFSEVSGDGDGVINPGESASITMKVTAKELWRDAANVQLVIRCNNPAITITDSTTSYDLIEAGQMAINFSDPFAFTVDENALLQSIPFDVYITSEGIDSEHVFEETYSFTFDLTLNQPGFPVAFNEALDPSLVVADIDNDDDLELIFTDCLDGNVHIFSSDGDEESYSPFATGAKILGSIAVGDIDNDDQLEIVFASHNKHLYALSTDGSQLTTELDFTDNKYLDSTPVLRDLDNDDDLEIIFGSFFGSNSLYIIHHDGTAYGNAPYLIPGMTNTAVAVANFDNDETYEIVYGLSINDEFLHVINAEDGSDYLSPIDLEATIKSAPVIGDIDNDGVLEIICGSNNGHLNIINGNDGSLTTIATDANIESSPLLADIDDDDDLEIFVGDLSGKMYGFDHEGNPLANFPFIAESAIVSSPVIADIDSNGQKDIVFGDNAGKLWVVNTITGETIKPFPMPTDGEIKGAATIIDLDGDNDIEIILGAYKYLTVLNVKTAAVCEDNDWCTFRGNYYRTGLYGDSTALTDAENVVMTPIVTSKNAQLLGNYPNPFNPETQISFFLPESQQVELKIYNVKGQLVKTLVDETLQAGTQIIRWNGKNDNDRSVASGVYFYQMKTDTKVQVKKMLLMK